jgi:hypothetical protein
MLVLLASKKTIISDWLFVEFCILAPWSDRKFSRTKLFSAFARVGPKFLGNVARFRAKRTIDLQPFLPNRLPRITP